MISRKHVMNIVLSLELSDSNLYFYTVFSFHHIIAPQPLHPASQKERRGSLAATQLSIETTASVQITARWLVGIIPVFIQLATPPSKLP